MIVTREEAEKLWCPFARVLHIMPMDMGGAVAASWNRDTDGSERDHTCCIADRCMAWQWAERKLRADKPETEGHRGFCGLAGGVNG